MHKFRVMTLRLNLFIVLIGGMFVLWQYLQQPSESQSALLRGYSALRLILFLFIGFIILLLLFLLVKSAKDPVWIQKFENFLGSVMEQRTIFWALYLMLGMIYLALFMSDHQLGSFASYREAARPLLIWFGVVCLQILISYILIRGYEKKLMREYRDIFIPASIMLGLLGGLTWIIAITRIGLTPDAVYWQEAGVPILFSQVILACIVGCVFHFLRIKFKGFATPKGDFLVLVGLWVFACVIWLNHPLKPSYNALEPTPPSYQSYPFGDALRYDLAAQEFMIGKPIPADFFVKPFYSFMLVVFHLIGGQDYEGIVFAQVLLLACIPPLLFLLTQELSTPLAGVIAAVMMIFRESNGIALSNVIQVSHSRLLLSDVPTMGLIILLAWLIVKWSKQSIGQSWLPISIGGMIGLLVLIRGNPLILIPFILFVGFLLLRSMKTFWKGFLLPFGLGLMLVMVPWFWHNYQLTGSLVLQDPSSLSLAQDQLVQLYSETSATGYLDAQNQSAGKILPDIVNYILVEPTIAIRFTLAHYFHNVVHSYIFLPQSLQAESVVDYVKRSVFWSRWNGDFPSAARILLPLQMFILALGFGAAWKKGRNPTLSILILGIGYNFSVALTRRSGWRFNLPADWVTIVFYAIGVGQLIFIVYSTLTKRLVADEHELVQEPSSLIMDRWKLWTSAILFTVLSLGVAQGQWMFKSQSTSINEQDLATEFQRRMPVFSPEFLDDDEAVIVEGRGVYPVYFKAGKGMLNYSYLNFSTKPYNRLVFYVVNDSSVGGLLKTNTIPVKFIDGIDVVVVGCKTEANYIDALAVLLRTEQPTLYLREPFAGWYCPIPEP